MLERQRRTEDVDRAVDGERADELEELLQEVHRIEVFSRRLVRGVMAGGYTSVFRGAGLEFDVVREYVPGDDPRSVDWNVSARMGRPYVKTWIDERELSVLFVVDTSPSTSGGFGAWSVRGTAARMVACLALAAVANDDKVGMVAFGGVEERWVRPEKGRSHALRIVRDCLALEGRRGGVGLARALEYSGRLLRRRSIVFVVSDFLEEGYGDALARLRRKHDVVAVRIGAPELAPPEPTAFARLERLADPETGRTHTIDWRDERQVAWYTECVARWNASTAALLRRARVDVLDVLVPRTPSLDAIGRPIMEFFRMRELRGTKR